MIEHHLHVSSHFAKLILRWKDTNVTALKKIKEINDRDGQFLFMDSKDKQKHIQQHRLRNFKGSFSGQTIDLTKINDPAPSQKQLFTT